MYRDVRRRLDPDPDLSPFDVDNGDLNAMAENETFPSLPCQDQHRSPSLATLHRPVHAAINRGKSRAHCGDVRCRVTRRPTLVVP
jgi:hypothetical protein